MKIALFYATLSAVWSWFDQINQLSKPINFWPQPKSSNIQNALYGAMKTDAFFFVSYYHVLGFITIRVGPQQ